jgi:hypothetical protein
VRARAFDTEVPKGTLAPPGRHDIVDINRVPDQMRIFDRLIPPTRRSSDRRARRLLSPTLQALRNIGFIEAAKRVISPLSFSTFSALNRLT